MTLPTLGGRHEGVGGRQRSVVDQRSVCLSLPWSWYLRAVLHDGGTKVVEFREDVSESGDAC